MLIWAALAALVALWVWIELTPADVDPELVKKQGVPSSTHAAGESAVYRSPANPHGLPLLTLKKFTTAELWEPESFTVKVVNEYGKLGKVDLRSLVAGYQKLLPKHPRVIASVGATPDFVALFFAVTLLGGRLSISSDLSDTEEADAIVAPARMVGGTGPKLVVRRKDSKELHQAVASNAQVMLATPSNAAVQIEGQEFSQEALGTAIAAQLSALGPQQRWKSSDRVLVFTHPLSPFILVMILAALSSKTELILIEPGPLLQPFRPLEVARPTVVISEDMTLRTLVKHMDEFFVGKWIVHGYKRLRLAKGALPSATIPQFRSVRLVHTETGEDPYAWLDNGESANLRILMGSQLIRSLTTSKQALPMAQTVVGDYRAPSSDSGVCMGPPLPGYEIKTRNNKGFVRTAAASDWQAAGFRGSVHRDGCVYVEPERAEISAKYFYTGELD